MATVSQTRPVIRHVERDGFEPDFSAPIGHGAKARSMTMDDRIAIAATRGGFELMSRHDLPGGVSNRQYDYIKVNPDCDESKSYTLYVTVTDLPGGAVDVVLKKCTCEDYRRWVNRQGRSWLHSYLCKHGKLLELVLLGGAQYDALVKETNQR